MMTGNKLQKTAMELFGERGWVGGLAAALKRDRTTVYRYVNGKVRIPSAVAALVVLWLREFRATGKKLWETS